MNHWQPKQFVLRGSWAKFDDVQQIVHYFFFWVNIRTFTFDKHIHFASKSHMFFFFVGPLWPVTSAGSVGVLELKALSLKVPSWQHFTSWHQGGTQAMGGTAGWDDRPRDTKHTENAMFLLNKIELNWYQCNINCNYDYDFWSGFIKSECNVLYYLFLQRQLDADQSYNRAT